MSWWLTLDDEIARYVSECIKNARVSHQLWVELPLPEEPWEEIGADVFVFSDKLYLILVDYYSKWIEAICYIVDIVGAVKEVFGYLLEGTFSPAQR